MFLRQLLSLSSGSTFAPRFRKQYASLLQTCQQCSIVASEPTEPTSTAGTIATSDNPPPSTACHDHEPALPHHAQSWHTALRAALSSGDVDRCIAILERRCQDSANTSTTSRAFAEALRRLPPAQALRVYHLSRQHGVEPTPAMAVNVVRMYSGLGMLRHIENAIRELLQAGLRPHWSIYFYWAAAHAEAGQAEGVAAAAAASEAAGIAPSWHYMTMMVKATCKTGNPNKAVDIVQQRLRSGEIPPEPVWRALVHCHGLAGKAERAAAIFAEMQDAGVEPRLETWTALVNAYSECRMPERAVEAMEAMRATGIRPNSQTYTALLKGCAFAGDVDDARAALSRMRADGVTPTQHTWGAIISACAVSKDTTAAREVLEEMKASGMRPGVIHYTAFLTAFRHAGDVAGALQVLNEMEAEGVEPERQTWTEVMTLLGQSGLAREADEAFRAMKRKFSPDAIAYNVLVGALLRNWSHNTMDDRHSRKHRRANCPLLLRADEVFQEGWASGVLVPQRFASPANNSKILIYDLHTQGTWSVQLIVLAMMQQLATSAAAAVNVPLRFEPPPRSRRRRAKAKPTSHAELSLADVPHQPALLLITGRGLKRGWSPVKDVVLRQLRAMGLPVRESRHNSGTLIVPGYAVREAVYGALRKQKPFDCVARHTTLVDPPEMKLIESERWGVESALGG